MRSWSGTCFWQLYNSAHKVSVRYIRIYYLHRIIPVSARYLNIVVNQVQPFMTIMFPASYSIYQLDNSQWDIGWIVRVWFQEHSNEFQVMSLSPNSSNTHPIKHLCSTWKSQFVLSCYHLTVCKNFKTSVWALHSIYLRLPIKTLPNCRHVGCYDFESKMWPTSF